MAGNIIDLIKERVVLLDGGMGTEIIRHGFSQGDCPESWNIDKPDIIKKIHLSYFNAGSDTVLTNSFGVRLGAGLQNLSPPRCPKGVAPPPLGTLFATGSLGTGIATLSTWHGSCKPCTWHDSCYTSQVGTVIAKSIGPV